MNLKRQKTVGKEIDYTICWQRVETFQSGPLSFRFLEHPYYLIIACQQEKFLLSSTLCIVSTS